MGETIVTVEFQAAGDSTEVVLVHTGFPAAEAKEAPRAGLGRLPDALRGAVRVMLRARARVDRVCPA